MPLIQGAQIQTVFYLYLLSTLRMLKIKVPFDALPAQIAFGRNEHPSLSDQALLPNNNK